MINPRKTADKNFKSVESEGVPIAVAITKINPIPSSSSVADTPATIGFRPATIGSIQPPKQSSDSSIFDLNFPPLTSSNKDSNKKLHPIHQIDYKQPTCLNQDLSPVRSSYKFFKHRQNRAASGCKVDSSSSPLSSNSIMVLPNKRAIESQDIDAGKSAKMRIFSPSLSLTEEKYDQTNGNGKPEPEADFSLTNGTISTLVDDQKQQGCEACQNHYDDDNKIVIETIEDDDDDDKSDDESTAGIDQSKPPPKVDATNDDATNDDAKGDAKGDDDRCASNPIFPTESTQDSCKSNDSSNSATTSKSSNSGFRFYTTSNRNWRRKQDMSRRSVTVDENQNGKILADTSTSGGTAIDDQSSAKSAKSGKSKKSKQSNKSSTKASGHGAGSGSSSAQQQPLNESEGRKKKTVVRNKPRSTDSAVRKSNRLNRVPSRTDARPQRNVQSAYSKVALHEKSEAQQQKKKEGGKPSSVKSQSAPRTIRRSSLASAKIKKSPLPAQNQSSKHSNEPANQSSLPEGSSTTTATTTEIPNRPQTAKVVKRSQQQGQNSSISSSSSSSHDGSDPGQSGWNPPVPTSQMISSTPRPLLRNDCPENSRVPGDSNSPSTIIINHCQLDYDDLNHFPDSYDWIQQPKQISGPFIRIIRKDGKPAKPGSGKSTHVQQYDSSKRSRRSEIKRIEAAEQENVKFFVMNKPEEVKPLPAVCSNGNVGLAQCSNSMVKQCIQQCKQQQRQQQQQQPQLNTSVNMSQRYTVARQRMQNDISKWMCIFCKKQQHEHQLGPLFGPYFDPTRFLPEIWFHEDCYMWTMLPMVTPYRPLNPQAIHVIQMCWKTKCLRCGLAGANIQCIVKSCQAICLHYFCARQWNYFFDETSFKIYCPKHYESIVLGKTIDPMEYID